jgi:KDO2-lipid IV(A) lauroyltransferase
MALRFAAPRYWPTWLALGLLRLLSRLSYPRLMRVTGAIGAAVGRLPFPQIRVARRNIELCLPELGAAARQRVLRAHFRSVGMSIGETALVWFKPDLVPTLARVEGLEHLDAVRAAGQGVILLAAHFTTLEIAARIAAGTRDTHAVYKPSGDALLTAFFVARRGGASAGVIPRDDIRTMVRVLKGAGIVWYAPDQAYRGKGAQMVPFFGVPAATNTATSRLAKLTGAAVLPYFAERLPDGAGYRVTIAPPLADFPGDDPITDTLRFHHLIEAQVRRIPEQYLWLHKRFKGLDQGYPDYYGDWKNGAGGK